MKGQTTIEFIGSAVFFVLAVLAVLAFTADGIPEFHDNAQVAEKNLEAKYMTDYLLYSNTSDEPGLVTDYMRLDKNYLESDIGVAGEEIDYSYSQIVEELDLDYQHNIQVTWYPTVETHRSYIRGDPPESPNIDEPTDETYANAGNRIHYGSIELEGNNLNFLVASEDAEYRHVYYDENSWQDFELRQESDSIDSGGRGFEIEEIQNRDDRQGASVILSSPIEFGDGRDYLGNDRDIAEGEIIKLNRYPMLDDPFGSEELAKMEVLVW